MKWVEIITVRSADSRPNASYKIIEEIVTEELDETMKENMKVYRRFGIDSDISGHLKHDSDQSDIRKSTLGLQLAEALKISGLVSHSIWLEEKKTSWN